MGEFNYFDLIAAALVVLSAGFAYARGVVREIMAILVWVASAAIAYYAAPGALPYVSQIPVVGSYFAASCQLSIIGGFTIVFSVTLILLSLVTSILVSVAKLPAISAVNKGFGIMFGVLRGAFVIVIILAVNDALFASETTSNVVSDSKSADLLHGGKVALLQMIPEDTPDWLEGIYQHAMTVCAPPPPVDA